MENQIIQIDEITKRYGEKTALDGINLTIGKGSLFGLLGQNGAGKTTLIRIITGIITPDSGRLLHNSNPLDDTFRSGIGYLPEERGLYKKLTVEQNLSFIASLRKIPKEVAQKRILNWVERLDAQEMLKQKVERLSKGMQQKIQLIATLIHEPDFLILDEPFSGLDPVNSTLFKVVFRELIDEGKTIILSTHDMNSVDELCDQIALIHQSKLIVSGSPKELSLQHFKGIYRVETLQPILTIEGISSLTALPNLPGTYKYQMSIDADTDSRNVLSLINRDHDIVSFQRQLPTMNDLFIHYTK